MIRVYSGPGCMACRTVKARLTAAGIAFEEHDVAGRAAEFRAAGLTALPVVEVDLPDGMQRWAGMRPELLRALVDWARP